MIIIAGLALLFILPSGAQLIAIFSYVAAVYLFLVGISFLITAIRFDQYLEAKTKPRRQQTLLVLEALFLLALGALIIIFPTYTVRIIIGVTLLVIPTLHLIFNGGRREYFLKNGWKYLIGIIFILAAEAIIDYVFLGLGILLLLFDVYLLVLFIKNCQDPSHPSLIAKYFLQYLNKRSRKKYGKN
jgi:uncharacterized membrane protein YidH (DUF202 family)